MTQSQPETPEGPTIHRIIRCAIENPGRITGRNFMEDESSRQAGAVVLALAVHGYKIVPASEMRHPGAESATDQVNGHDGG